MGGVQDLLKFLSREGGVWVYGVEAVDVQDESEWAINPLSFEYGYVCWKDSKPAGEAMVSVGVQRPDKATLVDHGEDSKGKKVGWDEQMACRLMCVSGDDVGVELNYRTSTYGGIQAIKSVMKEVGAKINAGKGEVVAIVTLENDSYIHADHGKTYTPQMPIVRWTAMEVEAPVAGDAEEPASETETPVDPLPKAEEPAAAPRRRRRAASK